MAVKQQARPAAEDTDFEHGDSRQQQVAGLLAKARHGLQSGRGWFDVVLDTIAEWTVPVEMVAGREYRYLVGGEAFDWVLLAERLTAELVDMIPAAERESLIFQ